MSTPQYDAVTNLLNKHNYIVKCIVEDKTISCNYAGKFDTKYEVKQIGDVCNLMIQYKDKTENILLPNPIIRWYTFLDIARVCRRNKMSYNIIRYFNKDLEIKDFNEAFIPVELNPMEKVVEVSFAQLISDILKDGSKIHHFDNYLEETGSLYYFMFLKGLLV